ncbi:MAG: polymer-forming cytoskeletal protein [Steroidobacteraceae bacterium]
MFKRKTKIGKPLHIDTLIGAGTLIIGDVQFKGGLHLDGTVRGNVSVEPQVAASLSISDGGLVEGIVQVPNVVLNGAVNGDIHASERVELGATAKVSGNVYYGLIEMTMGAQINGKLIPATAASSPEAGAATSMATSKSAPTAELG